MKWQRADISIHARTHDQDIDNGSEDCTSGNQDCRPQLNRLGALVAAGGVAQVLVNDMTRLGHNGRAVVELHEELSASHQSH